MNETIRQMLINGYEEIAYTNNYIYGFIYKGVVYATFANTVYAKLDKASRGAGYSIRFRPTNDEKVAMLINATPVCSKEFFLDEVENTPYNKGEIFEKMVTEKMFHQVWKKDTVPFTDGGDIEADGIAYQVKFQNATFTNEKFLARHTAQQGLIKKVLTSI